MSHLSEALSKVVRMTFPRGGVHPPEAKELSEACAIEKLAPPARVVVPMLQHIGAAAKPVVKKKDAVRKGQLIGQASGYVSANVHAPVSGTVVGVDTALSSVTGLPIEAVTIDSDGQDAWAEGCGVEQDPWAMEPRQMVERIQWAGIVGCGGATFPTHVKLVPPQNCRIEHILINGAECEPYITSDYRLMLAYPAELVESLRLLMKITGASHGHIGVEENKPQAYEVLSRAVKDAPGIELHLLKVKYPQGAEHMLIKAVLGREIPNKGGLPSAIGCVVQNVATALAVRDALRFNIPLIDRVVTVTGEGIEHPANLQVAIGSSIEELVKRQGMKEGANKVILGGPMMGIAQPTLDMPVTKGTNAVLVLKNAGTWRMRSCIRCGRCVDACPYGLNPSEISIRCERSDWDGALAWDILECKECGCCSYVCPAKRRITHLVKFGKAEIAQRRREEQRKKEEKQKRASKQPPA